MTLFLDGAVEVGADDVAVEIADDEQRRIEEGLPVAGELFGMQALARPPFYTSGAAGSVSLCGAGAGAQGNLTVKFPGGSRWSERPAKTAGPASAIAHASGGFSLCQGVLCS